MAPHWTAADIPDQTGRTFLVTGANSGLGFETSRLLAEHGAHVVMTARDRAKGDAAIAAVTAKVPKASLEVRLLDLSDLDSVHAFASSLTADGVSVDVLVNNAGVMMCPRSLTKQGFERQIGTNHFGHFALTGLLLDTLRAGREPRVVTVASNAHRFGDKRIHFEDLTMENGYTPTAAYAQSKFANIMFGLELQRRLTAGGSPVRSILAHPGYASTNLVSAGPTGVMRLVMKAVTPMIAQSAAKGALPQLKAATDPTVEGGTYWGPNAMGEQRGYPKLVHPTASATDAADAARLWSVSEDLTGVAYQF
jgi:NAD(P)-dependent dehydrogenase (short-subunit alcohol dehydrogenase family)